MKEWHDFFVAQVGATAALTGLVFVALSVNITQILRYPWLPPRAAQTVIVLIGATVESCVQLVPLPSIRWTAAILGAIALLVYVSSLRLSIVGMQQWIDRGPESRFVRVINVVITQITTLPCVIGAFIGLTGRAGFEYWIAAGLILSLVFGLYNSWILLVEILR
jgi:modulator of FtsH protease